MDKKLINEIDRIHELFFKSQQLNETIGQLTSAAVKSIIRKAIKNTIKKSVKNNLGAILKKSPKYLDNFMQMDELFKKSQDEIIDALKKSDPQISNFAKNNPDLLRMSVRTHFKELVDAESKAITKELVDDLGKSVVPKSGGALVPNQMTVSNTLKKIGIDNSDNYARILSKDEIIPKSKLDIIFKNADEVKKVVKKVDPEDLPFVEVVSKELADPNKVKKLKSGWMGNFNFNMKKSQLINSLKYWGILNSAGKMTNVGWGALTVIGLGTMAMYGALQETGVDMTEVSPEILPNPNEPKTTPQPVQREPWGSATRSAAGLLGVSQVNQQTINDMAKRLGMTPLPQS